MMASSKSYLPLLWCFWLRMTLLSYARVLGRDALSEAWEDQDHVPPTGSLPPWAELGCYPAKNDGVPIFGATSYIDDAAMTVESCLTFCTHGAYRFAALRSSHECYCDQRSPASSTIVTAARCNMTCSGDVAEACGGRDHLKAYTRAPHPPHRVHVNPGPPHWASLGCYGADAKGLPLADRVFSMTATRGMTVARCTSTCESAGFDLAGLAASDECYCGRGLLDEAAPAPDGLTLCNLPCTANSSECCGGPKAFSVYRLDGAAVRSGATSQATGSSAPLRPSSDSEAVLAARGPATVSNIGPYAFLGCYTEATNARALSAKFVASDSMSLEQCASACTSYRYWGVEYGREKCYCGDSLAAGSVPATNQADCSFICPGNASEFCGAGNRLEMYQLGSTSATSTSLSTRSTTATGGGTGGATGLPAGWTYAGCYTEGSAGRSLSAYQQADDAGLTIESCVRTCLGLGYAVAGAEFAVQCFCGKYISNGGGPAAESDCSMGCGGSSSEKCGGPSRLSVYSTGPVQVIGAPTVQKTDLPGSWAYQGCLQDNAGNGQRRTFIWQQILTSTNDANTCLSSCAKFGYMAAGMEYGDECYCGDVADIDAVGAVLEPESDCNVPCSGDPSHICGGGSRLSYYRWTGPPLYVWHYPTGPAAGQYELLIGGVCVPLLTTTGVNGKVTFLEKYGTGEPNSTGAYELDLSLLQDFGRAWRPMHVKTDVFCSAALTLPDRVGRQINVGGWAEESTFGVRLYWPDGSPGTAGTHDWQENVNELSLQKGRWYPSAMLMTNGSILVVGGEVGSNAAAQPSLELLPGGGPVIELPFLAATDPNNLYPFLAVLPSGGIFITFYNQALIMDETSFATIKTMPAIPGTVSSTAAGRTYPLEGAAMLLPQHAPYTDPLTVLICGGSTPTTAMAVDNCVSIEPEAADPVWTVERMPSQRVMSCMTALPDGTYLILNGAHHGVAGFGLATDANLNAVLYDPSLPVQQRFSVMQNTSVARLYHSESVLLPDGRVMVSGSDPQDGTHPEEYRVEVFVPPYLLSGLGRPSFSIGNKDWSYGEAIAITVTAASGSTANVRVSLLGAVSSTHGNSMGQRTLFPAVTCAGDACTITAPPNVHVCPAGWYQVFVLDGPTPSESVWVRIGGDPGRLGNWPNFADFDRPGL